MEVNCTDPSPSVRLPWPGKYSQVKFPIQVLSVKEFKNCVSGPWRHNTQHNDIQHNDFQHYDTQHNSKKPDTQHNGTWHSILLC
jgi:hypothetical protein